MLSKGKLDEGMVKQGMNWLGNKMKDMGTAMTRDAFLQPGRSGKTPKLSSVLGTELSVLADKYAKVKPLDSTAWHLSKLLSQMSNNVDKLVADYEKQNQNIR